jgi:hypothetical protein
MAFYPQGAGEGKGSRRGCLVEGVIGVMVMALMWKLEQS